MDVRTRISANSIRETLKKIRLFADWPDDVIDTLTAASRLRRFADGDIIISANSRASGLFVVAEGAICNRRSWTNGKHMLMEVLMPGQITGLLPLFDGIGAAFEASARGKTTVIFIPKESFLTALDGSNERWHDVVALLCRRTRVDYENVQMRTMNSTRCQLAKLLLYFARGPRTREANTIEVEVPISQDDIAAMMGSARQTVNREMVRLIREGIIARRYRRLHLLDVPRLTEVAQEDGPLSEQAEMLVFRRMSALFSASD